MKLEVIRNNLKNAISPFEEISDYLKEEIALKIYTENETCFVSANAGDYSLIVKVDGKVEVEGEIYLSLEKTSSFLKKYRKNRTLSIRYLNDKAVILDEELEQHDVSLTDYQSFSAHKEEKVNIAALETLALEKGLIEVGRTVAKKNELYPILSYAKCSFSSDEFKLVSFDEDTMSIKRIGTHNNELEFCFYLNKAKLDAIVKVLSVVTDTYVSILYGKHTNRIYVVTESTDLSFPVDFFKEIQLENVLTLEGRFFPVTLDSVANDLKMSVPRRALTDAEREKYTQTLNKSKQGTPRWNEAATILKYGLPIYSPSEIMLKPYFCKESQRLRFIVSGTKTTETQQSFLASTLIQSLKDCEGNAGQIKIPENLNDPIAFVYQDDSSTFERYFMLTSVPN